MLHVSIINLSSNELNFLHILPCFDDFSLNENVDIKFSAHTTFLVCSQLIYDHVYKYTVKETGNPISRLKQWKQCNSR